MPARDVVPGDILCVGLLIGGLTLAMQAWAWNRGVTEWQTMVFTVLVFAQLCHCLAIRSERDSLLSIGLFSNAALLAAILLTVLAQMAVIYVPLLNTVFRTAPLAVGQLGICFAIASIVLVAVEIEKMVRRRSAA